MIRRNNDENIAEEKTEAMPAEVSATPFLVGHTGGQLTGSMILKEIEAEHIKISPFDKSMINPNSVNLTLNKNLLVYDEEVLDFKKENKTRRIIIPNTGLVLKPNMLYIGSTNESVWTDRYIQSIEGRSSVGRLGLSVHLTAGFGDIGFGGTWTLEIVAAAPIRIYPDIEIAQVSFTTPYGDTDIQYDGRYQGQSEPVSSRSFMEKKVYINET
jgi:dCTP deaminase